MTDSNIPTGAANSAAVNAPPEVTLYHDSGRAIRVPPSEADFWLSQGFTRFYGDPQAAGQELIAVLRGAAGAIEKAVTAILADGVIDTRDEADYAVAVKALHAISAAWAKLDRALSSRFDPKQGEPVTMLDAAGQPALVDPGQVDLYTAQGWRKA